MPTTFLSEKTLPILTLFAEDKIKALTTSDFNTALNAINRLALEGWDLTKFELTDSEKKIDILKAIKDPCHIKAAGLDLAAVDKNEICYILCSMVLTAAKKKEEDKTSSATSKTSAVTVDYHLLTTVYSHLQQRFEQLPRTVGQDPDLTKQEIEKTANDIKRVSLYYVRVLSVGLILSLTLEAIENSDVIDRPSQQISYLMIFYGLTYFSAPFLAESFQTIKASFAGLPPFRDRLAQPPVPIESREPAAAKDSSALSARALVARRTMPKSMADDAETTAVTPRPGAGM